MSKLKNKIIISNYINNIRFDLTEAGSLVIYLNSTNGYSEDTIRVYAIVFNNSFVAIDFSNNTRKYIINF